MVNRSAYLNDTRTPLVSLRVFNYNYGKYLRECFDSIIAQTYPNIEICFSDNASTDDSWEIALEFKKNYPKIMNVARNFENLGVWANVANCISGSRGKYIVNLCSDDSLDPEFVEKCVTALEANRHCGFAMVNRNIMDEQGHITYESPFYNQSCVIKGSEQAAIFMMAAVNPSVSQVMYDAQKAAQSSYNYSNIASRWYGSRFLDFKLCCNYSMAYIKDSLINHRLHGKNDSLQAANDLIEIIGPYLLHRQFADMAKPIHFDKVIERLPAATEKLAELCLRYCIRFLTTGKEDTGKRYYHLSVALTNVIEVNPTFQKLSGYWSASETDKKDILNGLQQEKKLVTRQVSYDPPPGSIPITSYLKNAQYSTSTT